MFEFLFGITVQWLAAAGLFALKALVVSVAAAYLIRKVAHAVAYVQGRTTCPSGKR